MILILMFVDHLPNSLLMILYRDTLDFFDVRIFIGNPPLPKSM
jgi:hypothetical protein